ncbi:hypothetical protein [Verrucomicrobium sp. GAS474]|uniref:hypothetical protein n=1 Tax=Verrucomicrobium sp. GAS474 TaxID=1882831 RepID=UPI000B86D240|nr:hypothetical protein [Verrucomicrobium sp. GAS474]
MPFVALSPLHRIDIAEAVHYLVGKPQENDFPLHTIMRKNAPDGRELLRAELILAGRKTREAHAAAWTYPVHFLKTYHPLSFHPDPAAEYENARIAAEILGTPPPIGHGTHDLRLPFFPGKSLSRFSPFTDVEPPERCLGIARETPPASLIGLWRLAEGAFQQVERLHARRFIHGDLELHNIVVCTAPIGIFLIDFESSVPAFSGTDEEWEKKRQADLKPLFELAVFLQAGLGRQRGELAERAEAAIPRLFRSPDTFRNRLEQADRESV